MIAHKGALHCALKSLVRVLDRQSPLPALTHVRMESTGTELRITATDLTTWISTTIPCEGTFSGGLPGKALLDFTKPDGADKKANVEFKPVEGGKVVVADHGSMIELQALPIADFPMRPSDKLKPGDWRKQVEWNVGEFREKVGWVIRAVGLDETRGQLTGVMFGEHEAVATDGHRLHRAALDGMSAGPTLVKGGTIAALLQVMPKQGAIVVSRAGDLLRFAIGDWKIDSTLMSEKFPPYHQVIPAEASEAFHAIVDGRILRHGLAKLTKSRASHRGVRLKVNGQLEIERTDDASRANTVIPLVNSTHDADSEDFVIGVDARYLAEALEGAEAVTMRFFDPLSPIVCETDTGCQSVVMPMHL